jgi:opacity protein-like surface antigen
MRKFAILFGLVLLAAGSAMAQEGPSFEVAGTYQYVRLDGQGGPSQGCHGFDGNAAVNVNKWLGIAGDFGYCRVSGMPSGSSAHNLNYLFGPRVSFRNYGRVTPYLQFLLGASHATVDVSGFGSASDSAFAFTIGGGTDVQLTPHVAFRAIQFEFFPTRFGGTTQNNLRLQTGLVYRFGK